MREANIPMKVIGEEKVIQLFIEAYQIRIVSRQRFIPGKSSTVVRTYGIEPEKLNFFPIM